MNEDGNWVDYSGNEVNSYLPDQLSSANNVYMTYYSLNFYNSLSTIGGSSTRNIVCEKAAEHDDSLELGGSEEEVEQCSAPATYDDFASSMNSRIEAVVQADILHAKKADRSIRWLKKVVQKANK